MKFIGIGCFHFGINFKSPFHFSSKEYIKNIKSSLEKINSVTEIEVISDPSFEATVELEEEPDSVNDGGFFPPLQFLKINFSIFIPARIQEMILNESWAFKRTKTENFKVYMVNDFYGPVTYVECLGPEEGCDPSYAVRVVRTFLSEEFKKIDAELKFEFLGPSPFHADLFLSENEASENIEPLECIEKIQRGYNILNFYYDPSILTTEDKALEYFIRETSGELALFYNLKRLRVVLIRQWTEIREKIERLTSSESKGINRLNIKKSIENHKLRNDLIGEIYQQKADNQLSNLSIKNSFTSEYENSGRTYLRKYIENSINEIPDFPIDLQQQWLIHSDARILKNLEISAILISALLGGLIGSIATRLL